jgi:hypothetical protein
MYQFTSAKKMASVLLAQPDHYLLLNKGAAEWVLDKCDSVMTPAPDGVGAATAPLTPELRTQLGETVVGMASRGLRCICLASRTLPLHDASRPADFFDDSANLDRGMTALAIVGIKDPVSRRAAGCCVEARRGAPSAPAACRDTARNGHTAPARAPALPTPDAARGAPPLQVRVEVPAAVERCQNAGITVRMVTGACVLVCALARDARDATWVLYPDCRAHPAAHRPGCHLRAAQHAPPPPHTHTHTRTCNRTPAGDNIHTARHIARECGILTDGGIALEGPEFRSMPIQKLLPLLPKLQVRGVSGVLGVCFFGGGGGGRQACGASQALGHRRSVGHVPGMCRRCCVVFACLTPTDTRAHAYTRNLRRCRCWRAPRRRTS